MGALLAGTRNVLAPPPLVTGDVPTADHGTFEWYVGGLYQDSGSTITWAAPFSELVYGITRRWEVTAESAFLIKEGEQGVADTVLGTKYVLLTESEKRPGVALSFEAGLPTGDAERGLGAGAPEYEFRVRTQKTFGWFTPILNVGYAVVEEPTINGVREERCNTWRASCAQEWQVARRTKLLTEIYGKTSDEPGGDDRLAANLGFKHKLSESLQLHGAIGKSLREDNRGGPELRAYLGVRYNFDAPWTRN
jgi:hypothetical protein